MASRNCNDISVLVTGGKGQLAAALARALEDADISCVTLADRDTLDITDREAVRQYLEANSFTHIINCAAYTAVDKAESEPEQCRRVNVDGVGNIARAVDPNRTRILHISTDFVFDGTAKQPYTEDDQPNPLSVYGSTKLLGEKELFRHAPESIVVRTGWLYSETGTNFLRIILRAASGGKSLRVVNDQRGTPTYAPDLARAVVKIMTSGLWIPGIYNYSNAGEATWYDFAAEIIRLSYPETSIAPCSSGDYPAAAKRPAYSVLDKNRISEDYKVDIPDWHDSLKTCINNIKQDKWLL